MICTAFSFIAPFGVEISTSVNTNSIKEDTAKRLTLKLLVNHDHIYKTTVRNSTNNYLSKLCCVSGDVVCTPQKIVQFFLCRFLLHIDRLILVVGSSQ